MFVYLFLKKLMQSFKVNLELANYFGIYLIKKDEENEAGIVCKLIVF